MSFKDADLIQILTGQHNAGKLSVQDRFLKFNPFRDPDKLLDFLSLGSIKDKRFLSRRSRLSNSRLM